MRLLLLNQYGLASGAPTGRILAELGSGLREHGHEIIFLNSDSTYGKSRRGFGRIIHEARAHLILLWRSLWCRKVDAVISLTSPACLAVTAGVAAKIHRAKHFHWVMDLYPDVGVRLGELKNGVLSRFLARLMRRAYQEADRVVVLDEDMREHLQNSYGVDSSVMEPFPPEVVWPALENNHRPAPKTARRWLYSGNFGRAHEIEVLLQIQKRLEDRRIAAELILQGQGAQFSSSRSAAGLLELRQVQWRPPASQESLGESLFQSDVLVVTRKAEMKGLLLPSKLMLAELSGKAILWIGDTDGKTAQRLKKEGRHGVFAMTDVDPMAAWLQHVFEQTSSGQVVEPKATRAVREESVCRWEALLGK
jgi:putative colanic acid biosynthesis glycosyltransferase WcaI